MHKLSKAIKVFVIYQLLINSDITVDLHLEAKPNHIIDHQKKEKKK